MINLEETYIKFEWHVREKDARLISSYSHHQVKLLIVSKESLWQFDNQLKSCMLTRLAYPDN